MSWLYVCERGCRSPRCPAARERIAAGWRNGVSPAPGVTCAHYRECIWPKCRCVEPDGWPSEIELSAEQFEQVRQALENPKPLPPEVAKRFRDSVLKWHAIIEAGIPLSDLPYPQENTMIVEPGMTNDGPLALPCRFGLGVSVSLKGTVVGVTFDSERGTVIYAVKGEDGGTSYVDSDFVHPAGEVVEAAMPTGTTSLVA